MALDGVTIAALAAELNGRLSGGRISKIAQPEGDAILLTIKTRERSERLLLSANASLPLAYLTEKNLVSPMTAPGFCMLLRKHLSGGRILSVSQPGLERVLQIRIEHLNELGDQAEKLLSLELMGKHSNLIFVDGDGCIIDSIKHISASVSTVREVLPGREYFIPNTASKADPLKGVSFEFFRSVTEEGSRSMAQALTGRFLGLSPVMASELCFRAGIDPDASTASPEGDSGKVRQLYKELCKLVEDIANKRFSPVIYYDNGKPLEFAALKLTQFGDLSYVNYSSVSSLLEAWYAEKNAYTRMRQRSADLRKIVATLIERCAKKLDIQRKQLEDTEKKERYRLYGELINTYGYGVEEGASSFEAPDFYHEGETLTVPLDPELSMKENAKHYFDRYGKLKRTEEAVTVLIAETEETLEHLMSIQNALEIAETEADLSAIRRELSESGYIKKRSVSKGEARFKSKPLHYRSSDGFDLYVGKNNYQNDELTFRFASSSDWWFHAKKFPGSHVILHVGEHDPENIPDRAFNEAGALAAYYSKGRGQTRVEIDYVRKKEVKKPAGSRPGFVVYYTNYSMAIDSDISALTLLED
ncbi:MAG: NFACT family protein [Lachnospiraceae bacterium]|nr:NFACT family protein [Lachnospiraceae bacterium]